MVDQFGRWTEENDYSIYPKEKWCDYDRMAIHIRKSGYKPITDIENLIGMIFAHYEGELEETEKDFCIDECICFVEESGGLKEFDYYC